MAGILDRLRYLLTGRAAPMGDATPVGAMRSRIDSAQTTRENAKHWAQADAFSADAAYDPHTRFTLRNRCRYEAINNGYAKASVNSAADDTIGTGPRLQLTIPGDTEGRWARTIEANHRRWSDETKYAMRLHTSEKSRVRDGGCFGIFDTNDRLQGPVKFDVRWVEDDMCASGFAQNPGDPYRVDGIKFDRFGNPIEYTFYVNHPGNLILIGINPLATYVVPAERVVQWYDIDRHGQHRGIPSMSAALPIYSQLRRWTLSCLTAAEFASMLAGIMSTKAAPGEEQAMKVDQWELFELVRGALLTLPEGWSATQFRSENPPASYSEFKKELLNEAGRATGQPLNVITGNSSGYNFSSARCDLEPYHRSIRIRRNHLRLAVLDPIFRAWYVEAVLVGDVPADAPPIETWAWAWNFDGLGSLDQNKDALADDTRIKNGTSTYAEILAEYGQDWQAVFEQLAKEKAYAAALGLPWPVLSTPPSGTAPGGPIAAAEKEPRNPQPGSAPREPGTLGSLEQTVRAAFDEAGIDEQTADAVMDMLAPTFAEVRTPRHHLNGHAKGAPA